MSCCAVRTPALVQHFGHPLQFLDGFGTFQLHQLMAVARFHPADPEIGHEETHHVAIAEVGDERRAMGILAITALTSPRSIARSAGEERWTRPCTLMP